MMQYIYQSKFLVIIDGGVYVFKYEKCNFNQAFLSFQTKQIFIGKSKNCRLTEFSGANDNSDFDGNTLLLECEDNEYVYISGLETFEFKTNDKIIDYISLMGTNMVPYTFAIVEKYTYFISTHYKFIENDEIEEGTLLNATNDSSDPFDYRLEKCGIDSFKKLECSQFHTFYPHDEDDDLVEENEEDEDLIETNFTIGNNEVVKIFKEKCVMCCERDSIYTFRQSGHQCICDDCYQNRSNTDLLKCVFCKT